MLFHPGAALIEGEPGLRESGGEFLLGLILGFAERHLHAAVSVDLAFAGGLDGEVDHVLVVGDNGGLRAIGLSGRHAAERLEREDHVRQVFVRVVDVLGDFEVAFAAAGAAVVEGVAQALQLVLIGEVMGDAAERLDDLVIFALEDGFGELQFRDLLAIAELDLGAGAELPHRRQDGAFFEALEIFVLLDHLVNHVHDPGADGLHQNLRAFLLQEVEHVDVAVALGGLRPEFAGDLDDRLHAQAVDVDTVESVAHLFERGDVLIALELVDELADVFRGVAEAAQVPGHAGFELPRLFLAENLVQVVHASVEHAVGVAGVDLVGTQGVGHLVHHVAAVEGVEDAEEEVDVHFQAGFGVGLGEAAGLLEEEHAEAVEPGVAQGEPVLGFVHAEATRPAGAGGEEDVAVDDFLLRDALLFEALQVLDQVADGEVGGVALAVVAVLLAGLKGFDVGSRYGFGAVAQAFEGAVHQLLVLPGEAAEEQRGVGALVGGEGALGGLLEVMDLALDESGFALQSRTLFSQASLDGVLNGGTDLHKVGSRRRL